MNRFLRAVFLALAAVFGLFAVLTALDLRGIELSVLPSKIFWAMVFGSIFFGICAFRFSVKTRFKIFLLLLAFGVVEVFLQAIAWLGLMPALNTKERLPWGRVYWSGEGLGNSIRNRFGWYFPAFDLDRTNRVAVIGDSFVEAAEVHRSRSMGAVLREKLRASDPSMTAMSFGDHGSGPAQYFEILKYARRHFGVSEAVIVVYLGSDVTDCSPGLRFYDPSYYLYYHLDGNGIAALDAQGEQVRAAYALGFEALHRSPWIYLPRLAASHCMSLQLPLSVIRTRALKRRMERDLVHNMGMETPLTRLGLKGAPFALNPSPEVREGMAIVKSLLDQANEFSRTNGIRLSVVTVPFFPPDFYTQTGASWTMQLGEYDFLKPDRELQAWAAERKVQFLSLAERMRSQGLSTKEIKTLYLSNGCGHFSEAGHRFAAEAMKVSFFAGKPK